MAMSDLISGGMLSAVIAGVSSLLSAFAVVMAFVSNVTGRLQYAESVAPQLSMTLTEADGGLFLTVANTGRTAARNVAVTAASLKGAEAEPSALLASGFDLYPSESVSDRVGSLPRDFADGGLLTAELNVRYTVAGRYGKTVRYDRSVSAARRIPS